MAGGSASSSSSSASISSSDVLRRIQSFVLSLARSLFHDGVFSVSLARYRTYCSDPSGSCACSFNLPSGKDVLSIKKESHASRMGVMFQVLVIIQNLLQENKHASKRDIYYMHPAIFSDQTVVDQALNDICILLDCSRHHLNVVPVGRGLVMGWLKFSEAGRKTNCISSPSNVHSVPVYVEEVEDVASVARYILVVEKESVFQRLANDQFCESNHCIVITGKGYPDVSTRRHLNFAAMSILIKRSEHILMVASFQIARFLSLLVECLGLPVYCLVDYDPYGFDIMATYRFGSMQMAYDANMMRVPKIRWLGVFHSDLEAYNIPEDCLLPFTPKDKNKAEAMLARCYLHKEAPRWRLELEIMLQKRIKFEIEALSVHSLSFLSEYIPRKIEDGSYV